ncbi:MAG TPA: Tex family protein [Candidatus Kapabacteria bacterium]|nr:Tex family protein [Candidatus Kapabacteria bacterium]
MLDIRKLLAEEFNLQQWQIDNTLNLHNEGATLHFIARYRKERTGNLDEVIIRQIFDRFEYLIELEERKKTVLNTISEQGKLTDELKNQIENCLSKTELEDLYLPFKPKKRTRATIAKEKGLEPLAQIIKQHNTPDADDLDLLKVAEQFVNLEKGVASAKEAISGAADIIAEEISEIAEYRSWIRNFIMDNGYFTSQIKNEFEPGSTKYETYRDYKVKVKDIQPHAMLALRRGEAEGVLLLDVEFDEEIILNYLKSKIILNKKENINKFYETTIKDSFTRLIKNSIIGEVRLAKKVYADEESIKVFEKNLRQILLAAPAGQKRTIGIDPGFRTGCKLAVLDETGKFLEYKAIFPFNSEYEKNEAKKILISFINNYRIELIAIGNGTASRETETFVRETIANLSEKPILIIVNESGASVYSASKVAQEEFPELDLTVRGAISIGRRLQDPLAELVKIDPKSIGVGQYQHDVDQKLLKKKLEETVSSCVNYVGVDLNTASKELLTYVSGITPRVAEKIIEWRNQNGKFTSRKELLSVPFLGEKTFEQAAGFLRIRNAANILDNTAVHPESYYVVEMLSRDLNLSLEEIVNNPKILKSIDLKKYCTDNIGLPTLLDIIAELEKPGRDPRDEFRWAQFCEGINEISDLKIGMILEGVVTNITNFGSFVDIGVHQDGLVHISEISHNYVNDPTKVLKVGQIVKVKVLEVNEKLRRISLSIKQADENKEKRHKKNKSSFTIEDLRTKFSN